MSNTAPPTGKAILHILLRTMTVSIVSLATLPYLLRFMLGLDAGQTAYVRTAFIAGAIAINLVTYIGLLIGLRGLAGATATDEAIQRRVLRLPIRLAGAFLIVGCTTTVLAMLIRLMTAADSVALVFGAGLSAGALSAFLAVPMYLRARVALLPYALFFAREKLPSGSRIPIGVLTGYTVIAVAAIALVPAAVFGNARLAVARDSAANERALATARRVARAVEHRSPIEIEKIVSHMQIERAVVLVRMPSGKTYPEDRAAELAGKPGVEVPLGGELRGGAIRVVARPAPASHAQVALLLVALGLIVVATIVAASLARMLSRDARGITAQVDALAEDRAPETIPTVSASEIRRVTLALNRLLDRIPRLQLEKFLAVERADESRRMKSMFLANMSHDLRSPLNSILGFSELLTRGLEGPITDRQKRTLDGVHATGSQLLRLLSEILDTARAESGNLDLDRQPTPPATVITQARKEALRGRPERVGDRLTIELQAGIVPVRIDALRMQQALTHVLNWAIDAARDGSVIVELGDRDRPSGRAFVIEVRCDHVTTVDEEALLFQSFRKVDGVPGLHLGLPLARRLVEAQNGQIEPLGPQEDGKRFLGVRILIPRLVLAGLRAK